MSGARSARICLANSARLSRIQPDLPKPYPSPPNPPYSALACSRPAAPLGLDLDVGCSTRHVVWCDHAHMLSVQTSLVGM